MTDVKPIFSETSGDSEGRVVVDMHVFATGRTEIIVQGTGSIEGMRAWTASFNRAVAEVGRLESLWVRLDLTDFVGAPIPAQLTLVKWLVQNQHRLKKMGLIGGDTGALPFSSGWCSTTIQIDYRQKSTPSNGARARRIHGEPT